MVVSTKPVNYQLTTTNRQLTTKTRLPMKAIWNNSVIAESDETLVVENNHYFPADSIKREFFEDSIAHTSCPWKGRASYYSLRVNGELNKDAAWFYPEPKDAAQQIKDRVAFWKGVQVVA